MTEHQKLKKKAWQVFSLWIRKRDCDWKGEGHCVTCGKMLTYKQGQAGHFVPGRTNSILFDERNCHLQCMGCNYFGAGKAAAKYYQFMLKKYGQKVINELYKNALINKQLSDKELNEIIEKYDDRN